jgi:hypothetical protein
MKLQTACQNKFWWKYQDYRKMSFWFKQNYTCGSQVSILGPICYFYYIYKWSSNKYKGAGTILLAEDINNLIKNNHENILNQKINRIIKEKDGFIQITLVKNTEKDVSKEAHIKKGKAETILFGD